MKFPFEDAPNTAIIICNHVIEKDADILYVSHDEDDGMWQFLCGGSHEITDAKLVSLEEVFALDNSIAQLANMPCGYITTRKDTVSKWQIRKR